VEVLDGEIMPRETPFSGYDGILIGTSVHAGSHQRFILELADIHHRELNQIPSALFSVSIPPAQDFDEKKADDYNNYFSDQTHWNPIMEATFRGALPPNHLGIMKSLRTEALNRRRHNEIDVEHDYEFIDHITAEGFIDEFIDFLELHQTQQPGSTRPAP
jgi:menaquinone-dependent protoporphyrinogen oxidase